MRTHKQLVVYGSILQTLREPGCPFCRFLKEFQAARLQNASDVQLQHLCNFHMWGLAAVQNAPVAASIFLKLLDVSAQDVTQDKACDLCREIFEEESLRLREFVSCIHKDVAVRWLRGDAELCLPHGMQLRSLVPMTLTARIDTLLGNCRQRLVNELMQLRNELDPHRQGWGALGRSAEFLVSQRGLHEPRRRAAC